MPTNFAKLNCLESVEFFADSDFTFEYVMMEDDGVNPFDLTSATVTFLLFPYGQPENVVVQKEATVTGAADGECNVAIEPSDTTGFDGRYIQQIAVEKAGKRYRPAQGDVYIAPSATISGG